MEDEDFDLDAELARIEAENKRPGNGDDGEWETVIDHKSDRT